MGNAFEEAVELQETLTDTLDRIIHAIGAKRWSQVDDAWLEVAEAEPQPLSFHSPIIDRLIRKQDHRRFNTLYETYLDALLDKDHGQVALDILDYVIRAGHVEEWMRERLVLALQLVYGEQAGERLEELLNQSGLPDEGVPLAAAYQRFQDLMGARVGQVFRHRSWGLGVVRELDVREGKVVIDFDLKKNQPMTLDGVRNFLQRIPADHVSARIALDPAGFKETVRTNPGEVIHLALRSFNGRVKVSDLKRHLTERFLTDSEYKSFWNNARKAIKLDPWIDQNGAGANSELVLRTKPHTFFDEIFAQLVKAETPLQRFEALRDVHRHGSDAEMTPEDTEALYQLFQKPLQDGAISTPQDRLAHGLLFLEFADLFPGKENPVDVAELLRSPEALELVRSLDVHEVRRQALEQLIDIYPEQWGEMFADVVLSLDSRTVAWMEREMKARGDEHHLQVAFENIVAKPDTNPDLFIWAAKNILEGRWTVLADTLPPVMIFEELLSLLAELHEISEEAGNPRAAAARSALVKVRGLLNEGNARLFKKAARGSTLEEARRILQDIRLHNALSHQLKYQLESILLELHADLRRVSRHEEEEEKRRPSFHYTTRASLDRKRQELSQLLNQDIPAMASVIEAARQLGDLKENSEYHAAKDRQKLLMQQAAELEDLLARARMVEEREVTPDVTRFGTVTALRNTLNGERREVTLLGMWEAEPEKDVISYLTPFGSQLMGRKQGEVFPVTAQDGQVVEYEVLEIGIASLERGEQGT